jgi:hypothetical protein
MASNTTKFFEGLLEYWTFAPRKSQRGPTLKVFFDNLRCYPIIALFGLGVGHLFRSDNPLFHFAAWTLSPILLILLMALIIQSSAMFGFLVLGMLGVTIEPAAPREAPPRRREEFITGAVYVLGLMFMSVFMLAALNLFFAITEFMKRANF